MPSRRDLIRMTESELLDFLRSHKTMTLVSNGPEGHPHPMPMWFAVDDDGTVRMTTFRKSQKVRNLERDPRVALLVEDGTEYAELRGAVLYGKAEITGDRDAIVRTLQIASGAGVPDDPEAREAAAKALAKTADKRVLLVVKPERVVSWDHRKLGGRY